MSIINETFEFHLQEQIPMSTGEITRCGKLRIEVVSLLNSVVHIDYPQLWEKLIQHNIIETIFVGLIDDAFMSRECSQNSRGTPFCIITVLSSS